MNLFQALTKVLSKKTIESELNLEELVSMQLSNYEVLIEIGE